MMLGRKLPFGALGYVGFVAVLVGVPLVAPQFWVTLGNYVGLYSIVALGLVLLTGVAGQTSFGQAAFVGIGAYTTAVLSTQYAMSPWFNLVAGLGLTLALSLFLGFITLRMKGHYLPLATIAWGISLYFLFGDLEFLGGHTGITGIPSLRFFGIEMRDERHFYFLIWAIALAALWATSNLLDSRPGRAIRALRGQIEMAEAFGVDGARLKIVVFVYAALLACVSGWLYAHLQRFVNPTPFYINQGIEYLFMAVVGGAGSVWGAVIGATLITLAKQVLQDMLPTLLGKQRQLRDRRLRRADGRASAACARGCLAVDRASCCRSRPRRPSPTPARCRRATGRRLPARCSTYVRRASSSAGSSRSTTSRSRSPRRDPRAHRTERRGQEHDVQPDFRSARAFAAATSSSAASRSPAASRTRSHAAASAARSST